jgi:septal ring factor EnvC (AmiA/AmiB activator)
MSTIVQDLQGELREAKEQIDRLVHKLEETEKAAEDIRKKNAALLEVNKTILTERATMPIERKDPDWAELKKRYDLFLELARKHGVTIVVRP